MTNRRDFVKQLALTGIAGGLPITFFSPPSTKPGISSQWLELVSPESLGMDPEILKEIDVLVEQTIAIGHTPGAVVAVGRGNKMGFLKGYGYRQFYPKKEKISLDTLFDLASVTKVGAAATAMAIVLDKGLVSPDDLVVKYFPEFGSNGKDKITVRHLSTHTSGIGVYGADVRGSTEYLFKVLCALELRYPVGERFDYQDNNALMLGHIVEKVSGQNLREFTTENIYKPLGMADTMFNPDEERRARTAATEMRDGQWYKGIVNDFNSYNLGGIAGDTGLFSTAPDLAILSALWLGKGTFVKKDGSKVELFTPKTFDVMTAPQYVNVGLRGLLWDKRSGSLNRPWNMSPDAVGHGGWTGTSVWVDPKLDLFVVLLGNRRHPFGRTPNIYPTAASVGVVAVNSIIRKDETLSLYYSQNIKFSNRPRIVPNPLASLKGKSVGLIVSEAEIEDPNGLPAQLKNMGISVAAFYAPDESAAVTSGNQYNQVVPVSTRTDARTGAPVYAMTADCLWILPQMVHDADTLVFGLKASKEDSDDAFWFATSILGHTLQSASDHRLGYAVVNFPNPLSNRYTVIKDLADKLKPFGDYARQAREFGLTFSEVAAKINEEQHLELSLSHLSMDS